MTHFFARLRTALNARNVRTASLSLAAFAPVALGTLVFVQMREPANAATIASAPKSATLVEATTGTGAMEVRAVGDEARLINARLPFADGPLHAALPFEINGSDVDERRALLCLTQAVYYEAGFEPVEGRRAVAQVVLNRMRHPAFPKSVCGVVYQHNSSGVCQFTFVCDGALYRHPAAGAWKQAEAIAREALAGYVDRTIGEATHYHADYVAPRWAPLLAKVARIGQHIFYRWPGAWGQPAAFVGRYIGEPRDPLSMRPARSFGEAILDDPAAQVGGPVTDGTVLKRAANDVGGLLDTSKGWTLHIPVPNESSGAVTEMIAQQEHTSMSVAANIGGVRTAAGSR